MNKPNAFAIFLSALATTTSVASDGVYYQRSGNISGELRLFTQSSQTGDQDSNLSLTLQPEFYWEWHNGDDSLSFTPYLRIDENDSERTHFDIRELSWVHVSEDWELRTGLREVYWGVTEFQHLVDVINQFDTVDDIDNEDKLGQPMINLSLVRDWGIVDFFVLPGFRERTFPGIDGRIRTPLAVDTDNPQYESSAEQLHTDFAIRWSHTLGNYDIGAYWFKGTNREPLLNIANQNGNPVLTPFYEQMDQLGIDLQATLGNWLWKVEAIARDTHTDTFAASQAGFEYTFYAINGSTDIGLLVEYGWDERGENAPVLFQNDLSIGTRVALNDVDSTELLAGISHDLDHHSVSFLVEASRRFGNRWKLSVDGRFFSADDPVDVVSSFDNDDHIQLRVERYF